MPYSLEKTSPKCWSVINTDTKEVHAKCTNKKKGQAQIRLLHGIDSGKWKPTKKGGVGLESAALELLANIDFSGALKEAMKKPDAALYEKLKGKTTEEEILEVLADDAVERIVPHYNLPKWAEPFIKEALKADIKQKIRASGYIARFITGKKKGAGTRTSTSTSTKATTKGNITVTGGTRDSVTTVTIRGKGIQSKIIKLDTPLFIRMLEWSREDVKKDEPLHFATENILKLLSNKEFLTMEDYDSIISKTGGGESEELLGEGIKNKNIYNKMSWKQFWSEKCKGKKFGSREAINNAMKEAAKEWKSKKGGCTEGAGSEELLLSKGLGKSSANFSVNPPIRKGQCSGKRPKVMTQELIPQQAVTPVAPPPVAGPVPPVGIIATGGKVKVKKEKVRRTR